MIVGLLVNCPECGKEIIHYSNHITDESPIVAVTEFEQTDWCCEDCDKTFCIGDIDLIDVEDL